MPPFPTPPSSLTALEASSVMNVIAFCGGIFVTLLLAWLSREFLKWCFEQSGLFLRFGSAEARRLYNLDRSSSPPLLASQVNSGIRPSTNFSTNEDSAYMLQSFSSASPSSLPPPAQSYPPLHASAQYRPHSEPMSDSWYCYYKGPMGFLRTNGLLMVLLVFQIVVFFTGLILSTWIIKADLVSALYSLGLLTFIGLFHLGQDFRNVFSGFWILLSGSIRIGEDLVISQQVQGIVMAFNLMDVELCQFSQDSTEPSSSHHGGDKDNACMRWHVPNAQILSSTRGIRSS